MKPKQTFKLPSQFQRKTFGKSYNTRVKMVTESIQGNRELPLNRKVRTPFIQPISKLDERTQNIVKQHLTKEKVLVSGCHSNSILLSCNEPSINTVHGYVGVHLTDQKFWKKMKQVGDNGIHHSNGIIEHHTSGFGNEFYDVKRKMKYFHHSWNSDSTKSFDLTKELNPNFKNQWWNYYPTESINLKDDFTTDDSQIIFLLGKDLQSTLIDEGLSILNKKQLQ